jgi:hypothetical protein
LRQGELGHAARRLGTTEEERYGSSKTSNHILFGNDGPALGQTTYILHNPKGYEGTRLKACFGESRRDELLEEDLSEFGKYNPSI